MNTLYTESGEDDEHEGVAGAQGWVIQSLAPGESVSFPILLSVYTPHHDDGVVVAPDIHSVKVDDISQVDNRPATSLVPGTSSPYASGSELNVEVIKIYSITGQLIRTLDIGVKDAGTYIDKDSAAYWDGLNDEGEEVASGVYFYKLHAGDKVSTRKMVVLK